MVRRLLLMLPSTTKEVLRMKTYDTPVIVITSIQTSDIITASKGDSPIAEWEW